MKRILIVEDDQAIADLERDYLTAAGFEVEVQTDGARGLEAALADGFSLVLVDLMLPGLSGFEVCRRIREVSNVPLVVVSALSADLDKVKVLGLGADDFVTKPFSPAELTARVKAHLARYDRLTKADPPAEAWSVRGLELHRTSRRVWRDGREVVLTPREFDVLELFVTHPGRVFSKEEVFALVWKEQYGDTTTVTVHVRKLREKLGDDTTAPVFIKTVWGLGYRLDPEGS
jgi:DNA-binding response OmpR family regulator